MSSTECYHINYLHFSTLGLCFLETLALGEEHKVLWAAFSESTGCISSAVWSSKTTALFYTVFSAHLDGHSREEIVQVLYYEDQKSCLPFTYTIYKLFTKGITDMQELTAHFNPSWGQDKCHCFLASLSLLE